MPAQSKSALAAAGRPINERALLTESDAADYLSITRRTLYGYRTAGDITPICLGNRNLRYRRRDLDELIDKIEAGETHLERMKAK